MPTHARVWPYLEVACFADVISYNEAGDWTEVAASQGHQNQRKPHEVRSPLASPGGNNLYTLISDFWLPEL